MIIHIMVRYNENDIPCCILIIVRCDDIVVVNDCAHSDAARVSHLAVLHAAHLLPVERSSRQMNEFT
jgi:hypothetical protein